MTFLESGRLVTSNNLVEQAIKIVVIERKNYLFSTSLKRIEANAIDYTIIQIVKVSGLNAYKDYTNLPNLEFFYSSRIFGGFFATGKISPINLRYRVSSYFSMHDIPDYIIR